MRCATRALLGSSTLLDTGRATKAHAEHDAIVSAIEARDAMRAEAVARDHIKAAGRERLRRLVQAG